MSTKGQHLSEEHKKAISKSKKGKPFSGIRGDQTGHKHSEKWKREMSEKLKRQWANGIRKKGWKLSDNIRQRMSETSKRIGSKPPSQLGKHFTPEHRRKLGVSKIGEKNKWWKGGITPEINKIRNSVDYRLWREAVFAKYGWICQKCGIRSGMGKEVILNAHHILNFADYPELRFAIDNGITFCKDCHYEFHSIYGMTKNTNEQIKQFLYSLI